MKFELFKVRVVKNTLWKYAKLLTDNGFGDYEDSLSELRCKVLEGFENFNPRRGTVEAFACVIIKTKAFDYLKKLKKQAYRYDIPYNDKYLIKEITEACEVIHKEMTATLLLTQIEKNMLKWFKHQPCRYSYAVNIFKLLQEGYTKRDVSILLEISEGYVGSIFKDIKSYASNNQP